MSNFSNYKNVPTAGIETPVHGLGILKIIKSLENEPFHHGINSKYKN